MSVTLLSAHELHFAYGDQHLLKDVTLAVTAGEKVGLVGRNGCGKTSLFKILSGENEPDEGEVSRKKGLRVGYLPQEFELDGTKTVRENIEAGAADLVEAMRRYEEGEGTDKELEDLLHLIEVADGWNLDTRIRADATALGVAPMDALVGPLSGGEKRRVALCRALVSEPDLLLLDEPTNHLDAESIRWLEGFLRTFAGAVIFITHDRYFLDIIATRIIELAEGNSYSHPGNYTAYLEAKAAREEISEQHERRRQRLLKVELEWVRAGAKARTTKSKHRMQSYYDLAGKDAPVEERDMDLLIPPAPEIGNIGIELNKVGGMVGDSRWLFRNLTLSFRPGECTGIVGRNGVGKTTLIRICLGERDADEGTATIGKKVKFNYIDQIRMQLKGGGTVMDEVEDSDGVVFFGEERISVRSYLRRFLFSDSRVNERADLLSGGERARLMLAKVLKRGGNILVLDEPTNDLDLASLRMLEEALADFDGSVIVVSHDRYFLDRICDQVVAFEDDGVHVQRGNYSYYLEKRKEREFRARTAPTTPAPAAKIAAPVDAQPAATKSRKLSFKEERELREMEPTLLVLETRVKELETTLNDPEFYIKRSLEAPAMLAEVESTKQKIATLFVRWEELDRLAK